MGNDGMEDQRRYTVAKIANWSGGNPVTIMWDTQDRARYRQLVQHAARSFVMRLRKKEGLFMGAFHYPSS